MKTYLSIGGIAALVLIGILVFSGGSRTVVPTRPASGPTASASARTGTSATASATVASGASVQDIVPGLYPNPIRNLATAPGIRLSAVQVENNTDAAGNPVSDHLQFTVQNLTNKTLSNLEVYYTIMDAATGKKEGYYKQLTGFTLLPHASGTVHFDGQSGPGHYGVNMRGIYGTVTDKLAFSIEVSASGYAPVSAQITKAPGGAEVVGQ